MGALPNVYQLILYKSRHGWDMFEIRLTIDDEKVVVPEGATILDAARGAGSYVPALCDHPDLRPIGSC